MHLHLHSEYSLLDGAAGIDAVVKRAGELGMDSLAITDHGVMYGVIDFYTRCINEGIKPIIGCEVYTAPASRFDRFSGGGKPYGHLVLLCKNETGYRNLMSLVTKANVEGFYYKPRVDMELLAEHSEGLIALSACLRGDVPMAYLGKGYDAARDKALEYIKIFGRENFFLEIQNHGIAEEERVAKCFAELAREIGVGVVATNDVHYVKKEDALVQDVLSCIQTGKLLSDTDRMKMTEEEYYLKSPEEMNRLFSHIPEAVKNSVRIAEMCNLKIDMSSMHLPKIKTDSPLSNDDYLEGLCMDGLADKYETLSDELISRLKYELDVIKSMGYTDYFLIVHDLIKYAKDNSIPIGPGRGSAAGSLAAYALSITEVDPIKYGLIFERFLNPERVSMPDIDIDICYERRDELLRYVSEKYGKDRVAQIITFGTMAARAAIKDVARVMGIEISLANKVSKAVPNMLKITLRDALSISRDLQDMYSNDTEIRQLIDIAMSIEGFPRHTSTHAAGVVIGDGALVGNVPLQSGDGGLLTQYHMGALEKIGMLKMDFLGLRNLTIIKDTIDMINSAEGKELLEADIPLDDADTFALIQKGDTDALFQLENPGLQSFLRKFKPKSLDDIIISTSIYRPGPMEQIPSFLENVKNPSSIKYKHPLLEDILKPTYGVVIYQEQVMDIVRTLAGYSMGRADLVRRVMAKKKQDIMQRERAIFLGGEERDGVLITDGAIRRGIDESCANEIFDSLIDFANYAFNKSHAACYALVAYRTAYLKTHYPTYYLASVLKNYMGHISKCIKYAASFKKYGIHILKPDVNKSFAHIVPEGRDLRYGFAWLKNVGMSFPENIVKERNENGAFISFFDFIKRMSFYDISKRTVEAMIKCGCFDSLYPNRQVLIFNYERLIDEQLRLAETTGKGQVSWFNSEDGNSEYSEAHFKSVGASDYSLEEKLAFENEIGGMYFSGHPLDFYEAKVEAFSEMSIAAAADNIENDGKRFTVCGIISEFSVRYTKGGRELASMKLSDYGANASVIAFENVYLRHRDILKDGAVIAATITLSAKDDGDGCEMIMQGASDLKKLTIPDTKTLYIRLPNEDKLGEIKQICTACRGANKLCIYIEGISKIYKSDASHGVDLNSDVFYKISSVLGAENVKIK